VTTNEANLANPQGVAPLADGADHRHELGAGIMGHVQSLWQDAYSGAQSLWHTACDNPWATAAVVGGLAAGTALLVASRGRLASALGLARPNVLIIEDTPFMGRALQWTAEEQGTRATWITGVKSLNPFTAMREGGETLPLNLRRFNMALVDGQLPGELQGPNIVGELARNRVFSIGMSSVDSMNAEMIQNGAQIAARKPVVFSALVDGKLNLRQVLGSSQQTQSYLDSLSASFLDPAQEATRERANVVLKRFLT
jgi:hypothetical protein